jgi:hypothetical protein
MTAHIDRMTTDRAGYLHHIEHRAVLLKYWRRIEQARFAVP